MAFLEKIFGNFSDKELKKIRPVADKVIALEGKYKAYTDAELQAVTPALKARLAAGETVDDILPDAFAACREASDRVLGMASKPSKLSGSTMAMPSMSKPAFPAASLTAPGSPSRIGVSSLSLCRRLAAERMRGSQPSV